MDEENETSEAVLYTIKAKNNITAHNISNYVELIDALGINVHDAIELLSTTI